MTLEQLDDILSQPSKADCAFMRGLEGDLLVLGAGGKMGPSQARLALRASRAAGTAAKVFAVSRFTSQTAKSQLAEWGVEPIECDLLDRSQWAALPEAANVLFLAGRKFGSTDNQPLTWATNVLLPAIAAERYRRARIVVLSSGNVYPIGSTPSTEETPPDPMGEYAQTVLGRERVFAYYSGLYGIPVSIIRLNYAIDLRYGVLLDIGQRVWQGRPVPLTMGAVNVIWQRDANSICLRSLGLAASTPRVLNVTGPEALSVRDLAERFGAIFGIEPSFESKESESALLSDSSLCWRLFGAPTVTPQDMIQMTADWIRDGGPTLNKPTHFEVRNGRF